MIYETVEQMADLTPSELAAYAAGLAEADKLMKEELAGAVRWALALSGALTDYVAQLAHPVIQVQCPRCICAYPLAELGDHLANPNCGCDTHPRASAA